MMGFTPDERRIYRKNLLNASTAKEFFDELQENHKREINHLEELERQHPKRSEEIKNLIEFVRSKIYIYELFYAITLNEIETREYLEDVIDALITGDTTAKLQALRTRMEESVK